MVRRPAAAEDEPVVDAALAVDDQVPVLAEGLIVVQPDPVPYRGGQRLRGDDERVHRSNRAARAVQRRRPRFGRPHDVPSGHGRPVIECHHARVDASHPRPLDDPAATALDRRREPAHQPVGVHPRTVGLEGPAERSRHSQAGRHLWSVEPGQAQPPGVGRRDFRTGLRHLRRTPGHHDRAALVEAGVDALGRAQRAQVVDAVAQRGHQAASRDGAVHPRDRFGANGIQRRDPSAVATARAEADVLGLDDEHLQRRVALQQVVGGPQPGVAAADDADVSRASPGRCTGQRGTGDERRGPVPPQRLGHTCSERLGAPPAAAG